MSDGENTEKVVVTKEDTDNVRNYSEHFGVPLSAELVKALDEFDADPSYKNMLKFKLEIAKWIKDCTHESFKDPLWDHPKENVADIIYDLQFDEDVANELSNESDNKES